jgi:hypothetical protein
MIRRISILGMIVVLGACSSNTEPPNMELNLYSTQVAKMSRGEVIAAIEECRSADLQPAMVYSKVKINNHISTIIIDVNCLPSSAIERLRRG